MSLFLEMIKREEDFENTNLEEILEKNRQEKLQVYFLQFDGFCSDVMSVVINFLDKDEKVKVACLSRQFQSDAMKYMGQDAMVLYKDFRKERRSNILTLRRERSKMKVYLFGRMARFYALLNKESKTPVQERRKIRTINKLIESVSTRIYMNKVKCDRDQISSMRLIFIEWGYNGNNF